MLPDKEDSAIIRLRDNGAAFDPTAYAIEEEEPSERYGPKPVAALADDFRYRRNMGLNVTLLTLNKKQEVDRNE